jgi:hypothetical protein
MFNTLLDHVKQEAIAILARVKVNREEEAGAIDEQPLEIAPEN